MSAFAILPAAIVLVVAIIIPFVIGFYVYQDAKRRGMNAVLWALVAAVAPALIGVIVYLLVRGNYSDLRCPVCDTPVQEQFVVCPKCGTKLHASCPNCAAPVEPDWKVCPKCAQPLTDVQMDVHTPVRAKDNSIWKVLAIVIIIPILLIALLLFGLSAYKFSGSTSVRKTTTNEYYSEMKTDGNIEIADKVKAWVDHIDLTVRSAYALHYTHESESGNEHYFLVYIPCTGEQAHSGIRQSSSIFGTTLSMDVSSVSGQQVFFNICSSVSETPNLKIKLDGKVFPCEVTTVDYNPTLFYIVPKYDELDPEATGFWMPERISVVKFVNNHNEGVVEVE